MEKFTKITDELYYEREEFIDDLLVGQVKLIKFGDARDFEMTQDYSIIDCESPMEQLFALEMARINLELLFRYNPYVDVVAIEKQQEIDCGHKKFRVDFLLPVIYKNSDNKQFVIEIDGHDFHQKTKKQVEKDNERTRLLQQHGYIVVRFSGTEVYHKSHQCVLELLKIILSYCKYESGE